MKLKASEHPESDENCCLLSKSLLDQAGIIVTRSDTNHITFRSNRMQAHGQLPFPKLLAGASRLGYFAANYG
jgi:hypothetical protein